MTTIDLRLDPITIVRTPVNTVLHLTDTRGTWRPHILGHAVFFTRADAITYAKEESTKHPVPQRFAVYDKGENWIASYQCGHKLAAFTVEP